MVTAVTRVVTGVMSFAEMDAMMYKIEGEDLYLIGTSEHSMIGKFIGHHSGRKESSPDFKLSYSPKLPYGKSSLWLEERNCLPHSPVRETGDDCGLQTRGKPSSGLKSFGKKHRRPVRSPADIPAPHIECCSKDLSWI